jgi:para-nitrobenzyl esterase
MRRAAAGSGLVLAVLLVAACGRQAAERPAPQADPSSRRDPPAGEVVGFRGAYGHHAWLGLPYAAPPVAERRWRAPAPLPSWTAPREALAFGAACPQLASTLAGDDSAPPGTPVGDEDCLTLNIYAPPFPPDAVPHGDARLPVLFWIHGGGNTIGTSRSYDGGHLAASQGVLVVTANYRLGALGWFHHPALAAGAAPEEASGNFAILDLIAALRWVRENAAAFGGDPERVTIFGESAGGSNVMALLLSPPARGLFHRAVVQSGGTRSTSAAEASQLVDAPEPGHAHSAGEVMLRLLVHRGEAPDREAARRHAAALAPSEIAAFLRAIPPDELLGAYAPRGSFAMYDLPRMIRDGVVLPVGPFEEVLASGSVHRVPTILGTNRDETKLFLFFDPTHVRRWFGVFPQLRDRERYLREAELGSRLWKATGADEPALALAARGGPPVFVYRFDWDELPQILWADLGEFLGAAHGLEIPFVFGHFDLGREARRLFTERNREGREALAAAMMSYWAAFARDGDPGRGSGGTLPRWTPFDPAPEAERLMVLDTPAGGGLRMTSELVTVAGIVAEIDQDPRYAHAEARCEALAMVAERSGRLSEADRAQAACEGLALRADARD